MALENGKENALLRARLSLLILRLNMPTIIILMQIIMMPAPIKTPAHRADKVRNMALESGKENAFKSPFVAFKTDPTVHNIDFVWKVEKQISENHLLELVSLETGFGQICH